MGLNTYLILLLLVSGSVVDAAGCVGSWKGDVLLVPKNSIKERRMQIYTQPFVVCQQNAGNALQDCAARLRVTRADSLALALTLPPPHTHTQQAVQAAAKWTGHSNDDGGGRRGAPAPQLVGGWRRHVGEPPRRQRRRGR